MEQLRVAYQGERGAFSETAAQRLLGHGIAAIPFDSFDKMFASIANDDADCCIAPIENSLAGSIHRNYDLLVQHELNIAAETHLRVVHNLIAPRDTSLDSIRRVLSHPVALAQCTKFFAAHPHIEPIPVHDTAGGVRLVLERGREDEAGIASESAASIYDGQILARGIEDNPQNFTRFFLLTPRGREIPTQEAPRRWKTSLVFRIDNKPGALFRALGAFALLEIDLSKIESRPIEGRPWEYAFYLDVIGRENEHVLSRALANLRDMAQEVRVLGSYPTRW
ncbi:MAG TPA: prephenate dehydratase [Thermoanaerobaculia bacterium]|nr:prephenate dehydratase [Thermoanaerobaculia bacterium]